jgi:hypothetical protein
MPLWLRTWIGLVLFSPAAISTPDDDSSSLSVMLPGMILSPSGGSLSLSLSLREPDQGLDDLAAQADQ